jgi:FkbM family methyltransferase
MKLLLKLITKYLYGRGIGEKLGLKEWYYRKIEESSPGKAEMHGFPVFLDKQDNLGLSVGRMPEPETTRVVRETLGKGDVFVDVGAHIGWYTSLASRLVGKRGRVISFEPTPENFRILKRNVESNRLENVELHNAAVSDRDGQAEFYISPTKSGNHSLLKSAERGNPVTVRCLKLDSICKKADIVKIDVQGAEHLVLKGMKNLLKREETKLIIEYESYKNNWPGYVNDLVVAGFNIKPLDRSFSNGMFGCNLFCWK